MPRYLRIIFILTAIAAPLAAAGERDPANYSRVLLPVLSQPGAGVFWQANLWIRNDGAEAVDAFPLFFSITHRIVEPNQPVVAPAIAAHSTGAFVDPFIGFDIQPYHVALTNSGAGAILFVEKRGLPTVRFQYLLSGSPIVQLPVVPEEKFSEGELTLIPIAVDANHRYLLRIYDIDSKPDSLVHLEIYQLFGTIEVGVSARDVSLTVPAGTAWCPGGPCWPDVQFLPGYAAVPLTLPTEKPIAIHLRPRTAGLRIWAFVSATDNRTQAVTIFAPQ